VAVAVDEAAVAVAAPLDRVDQVEATVAVEVVVVTQLAVEAMGVQALLRLRVLRRVMPRVVSAMESPHIAMAVLTMDIITGSEIDTILDRRLEKSSVW